MTGVVKVLTPQRFEHAESPRWLGGDRLVWIDMATGDLFGGRLHDGVVAIAWRRSVGAGIGCIAPIAGASELVVATGRALVSLDPLDPGASAESFAALPPGESWFNDGVCDPSGRMWVGTQCLPREPRGALHSLETDGSIRERLSGVTVSNGIAFTPDGGTMYYIDTLPARCIEAFDVAADGELSFRRTIAQVDGGNPDGLAIDDDGCLWVAVWGASRVDRYHPCGLLLERIELPAVLPSAVALVGDLLVITTARVGLEEPGELDGALLGVRVCTTGKPTPPYRRAGAFWATAS